MEREKHILTSGGSVPADVCGQYEPESHLTNHVSVRTIRITLLFSSHYISSAFMRVAHIESSLLEHSRADRTERRWTAGHIGIGLTAIR